MKNILKNKKITLVLVLLLIIASLSIVFPAGRLHSSLQTENTAEYLANVAKYHTKNGKYTTLMVEPKDGSDSTVDNPYNSFHYLYGIFREGMATYAGSVNADKSHSIFLNEIGEEINFSFLNIDSGFGVKEYYVDKSTGEMVYKHEYYPIELMFYSNHPGVDGAYSFLYISQSRANSLLDLKGLEHTKENYKTLLNNKENLITLSFDGVDYKFAIDNIYYEQNYFYDALNEVMGEFFVGGLRYPPQIKRQALFFLRNYPYQNKYYIQYATKMYSDKDFSYKILDYNFKDDYRIDESQIIYFSNASYNLVSILLIVFASIILIVALLLMLLGNYKYKPLNISLTFSALLIPYLLFWILHKITFSILLFSSFSNICYLIMVLSFVSLAFFIFLIKRSKRIALGNIAEEYDNGK